MYNSNNNQANKSNNLTEQNYQTVLKQYNRIDIFYRNLEISI